MILKLEVMLLILIFGGAYQGKLAYALERFGLESGDVYDCNGEDTDVPTGKRLVNGFDKWIMALVKSNVKPGVAVSRFMAENKDAIVICTDISCGVVPVGQLERDWREAVGRALAELAGASDEVVRVFCGIPTRLK